VTACAEGKRVGNVSELRKKQWKNQSSNIFLIQQMLLLLLLVCHAAGYVHIKVSQINN
jgi:hypothetical protein